MINKPIIERFEFSGLILLIKVLRKIIFFGLIAVLTHLTHQVLILILVSLIYLGLELILEDISK